MTFAVLAASGRGGRVSRQTWINWNFSASHCSSCMFSLDVCGQLSSDVGSAAEEQKIDTIWIWGSSGGRRTVSCYCTGGDLKDTNTLSHYSLFSFAPGSFIWLLWSLSCRKSQGSWVLVVPNYFRATSVSLAPLPGTVDVSRQGDSTVNQGPPACAVLLLVMCSLINLEHSQGKWLHVCAPKILLCICYSVENHLPWCSS